MVNYLCLLGWSPKDDTDVLELKEVVQRFDLPQILRHNAKFDMEKLQWLNGEYLAKLDSQEYQTLVEDRFKMAGLAMEKYSAEYRSAAIGTTQGKTRILADVTDYAGFYFRSDEDIQFDPESAEKHLTPANLEGTRAIRSAFAALDAFDPDAIQQAFKQTAEAMGVKVRALVHPVRIGCTGTTAGPSLYHLIAILGKETVLKRIDRAIETMIKSA